MSDETSRPGKPYHFPDPPPLPVGPDPIDPKTKYILELYAMEIREHASNIISIEGLSPTATDMYKRHCFTAADGLDAAAQILRQNNRVHDAKIYKLVAAPQSPQKKRPWGLLGRFFTAGVMPLVFTWALVANMRRLAGAFLDIR